MKHEHKEVVLTKDENGQVVVSSREVAEKFEKEHRNILQTIRNLTAENSAVENIMIKTTFNHKGNEYDEYLLTRDGFSLLVMGFTGSKALEWKLKYIEAFNKMEQALQTNQLENYSPELQAIMMHDKKIMKIESDVKELQNNMTIDSHQQFTLKEKARMKVVEILGGKASPAYKELGPKVFSKFWNDFKKHFEIPSYRDTLKRDFDEAKDFITNWKPTREIAFMIVGANSQSEFLI